MCSVAALRDPRHDGRMGRIIALVLGLAAVGFAAKYALEGSFSSNPAQATRPKRQLDDVRAKAHDLEQQQQNTVDEIARKAAAPQ
jgi:hypothetical protein